MDRSPGQAVRSERKLVCFELAGERFGLDVSEVLGVNPLVEITPLPTAPECVEGVVNIRGKVIPIIALRKRLGIEGDGHAAQARIVVAKSGDTLAGIVVDGVSRVAAISADDVAPPSSVLSHAEFVKAVGRLPDGLLMILDLERVLDVATDAVLTTDGEDDDASTETRG